MFKMMAEEGFLDEVFCEIVATTVPQWQMTTKDDGLTCRVRSSRESRPHTRTAAYREAQQQIHDEVAVPGLVRTARAAGQRTRAPPPPPQPTTPDGSQITQDAWDARARGIILAELSEHENCKLHLNYLMVKVHIVIFIYVAL